MQPVSRSRRRNMFVCEGKETKNNIKIYKKKNSRETGWAGKQEEGDIGWRERV